MVLTVQGVLSSNYHSKFGQSILELKLVWPTTNVNVYYQKSQYNFLEYDFDSGTFLRAPAAGRDCRNLWASIVDRRVSVATTALPNGIIIGLFCNQVSEKLL